MIQVIIYVAIAIIALAIGAAATMIVQKSMAQSRAKIIIDDAVREAEDLKKNKMLEGREEALRITSDAEKQANQRLAKVQSAEAKMKNREIQLNQQQSENQRTRNELENTRANLDAQSAMVEMKKAEVEKLQRTAQDT